MLRIDVGIPISCLLTLVSVHDSQAASLYNLMESAYDTPKMRAFSEKRGHVPIIDVNPHR